MADGGDGDGVGVRWGPAPAVGRLLSGPHPGRHQAWRQVIAWEIRESHP